ncbi:MAG: magnesium transporter [Pirellulales bacterium]|nr:magnesium transporter [Pirellulales bacterium]
MTNTLYLPELREALAENNTAELREFCYALHPARTAEFMEGLTPLESWEVLRHADPAQRAEIFHYFDLDKQVEIIENVDRAEIGQLIGDMAPDDRVDLLEEVSPEVVSEVLPLVAPEERRDILRLQSYPEGTAGAVMTTDFARLSENLTVSEAIESVRNQAESSETVYYLYVVDDEDHLHGLVSLRQILLARPNVKIADIMERTVVSVGVLDDQEVVAQTIAKFDFQAIPVVDEEHHLVGIVTHDDVIDVVVEEAIEDAHRFGGMQPLVMGYLETHPLTMTWKRGVWLMILMCASLTTAMALNRYQGQFEAIAWLVLFLPLVISSGGNSGSQAATLVITALSSGDITSADWGRVLRRELLMGALLGGLLASIGLVAGLVVAPDVRGALVLPLTLTLVVAVGTLIGSVLPLVFRRLGLDPALMSNPIVAGIMDILGIMIYVEVALLLLSREMHVP